MARYSKENHALLLLVVGLLSWLIPGAGYLWLKERKRAVIIFVAVSVIFCIGLYVGSIGVIDPYGSWPWYTAQMMSSPVVAVIGHISVGGGYPVYGRPREIGQIYTGIAGLLNLLCLVNAVYLAHMNKTESTGG